MKLKLSSILIAAPLFSLSGFAVAAKDVSSDFAIRLFNNTTLSQPLNYAITSEGQDPVRGMLEAGDDHGKTVKIHSKTPDKGSAEIVITDNAGHMLWDGTVSYYGGISEFYTKTVSLDSSYSLGTNAFPTIQMITFDIRSQA